jgi:DNA processing protein
VRDSVPEPGAVASTLPVAGTPAADGDHPAVRPGGPAPQGAGGRGWPPRFVAGPRDVRALLVLSSLPSLTPRQVGQVAWRVGSAAAVLAEVTAGRAGSETDRVVASSVDPDALAARLDGCGARLIHPSSAEYPDSLVDLHDPPVALFVRGGDLRAMPSRVAVVGARSCSPLGAEVAESIGRGLAEAGVAVTSGGARGIDTAAHEGALLAGGPTIAVLGSGIDVAYPKRNARLLARIAEAGAVVSEYPPGAVALPLRFPARNRIVAALAEATVVVEGARGSGSLITADFALDMGRPVFAVPGPVTSPLSEVPLALIRDGAGLVRGAEDVLADLGHLDPAAPTVALPGMSAAGQSAAEGALVDGKGVGGARAAPAPAPADGGLEPSGRHGPEGSGTAGRELSANEALVLAAMAGASLPEHLARRCGLDLPAVTSALVGLEMRGLVRSTGGRFERRLSARR